MSAKPHQSIAQRLNAAQLAIGNSLSDAEIQSLVAEFGYSTAKLDAGQALYDAALAAVNAAKASSGAQQDSTQSHLIRLVNEPSRREAAEAGWSTVH